MAHFPAILARFSLRASLLLLGLVALLLLADRAIEVRKNRNAAVELEKTHLFKDVLRGAERQSLLLTDLSVVLRQAAYAPYADGRSRDACTTSFRETVAALPWMRAMSLVDPQGRTICTSAGEPASRTIADRDYFKEVLTGQPMVVSNYLIGRRTGTPLIVTAMPRVVDGVVQSVVVASVDAITFGRLSGVTDEASIADILLLDREGTVVAAPPGRYAVSVGESLAGTTLWPALHGPGGNLQTTELDGTERVGAYIHLEWTDGVLLASRRLTDILHDVDRAGVLSFTKIGLTSLFCLLLIWLGGERLIIRPIEALKSTAAAIGSGDLTTRVRNDGFSPELRLLGDTLNTMAQRLAAQDAELRSANDRLATLATTDALTGLANRRSFDEKLELETQRAAREREWVSLIYLDIDYFKAFNDRYGHVAGDECLRRVGAVLGSAARRAGDVVARIGGEEFAILLPKCPLPAAMEIAESLKMDVQRTDMAHADSPFAKITISLGVASLRLSPGLATGALVDAADAALYEAKHKGRNQIATQRSPVSLVS